MYSKQKNNRVVDLIETTFKHLNELIDVNTVVGAPIVTEGGEKIVPISKVTIGVMMGGGEYGKLGIFNKTSDLPYTAGNGALVSIKPMGFLVKDEDKYKILPVFDKSYEKIIDKMIETISKMGVNVD